MIEMTGRLALAMERALPHLERYLASDDSPPERLHALAAMLGAQGNDIVRRCPEAAPDVALVERSGADLIAAGPPTIGLFLLVLSTHLFAIADHLADQDVTDRDRSLIQPATPADLTRLPKGGNL